MAAGRQNHSSRVVGEILPPRLHSPIVLARDKDKAVGGADLLREFLHRRRRRAGRIFLASAPVSAGRPPWRRSAPHRRRARTAGRPIIGEADSHPVEPIRSIENKDAVSHGSVPRIGAGARNRSPYPAFKAIAKYRGTIAPRPAEESPAETRFCNPPAHSRPAARGPLPPFQFHPARRARSVLEGVPSWDGGHVADGQARS